MDEHSHREHSGLRLCMGNVRLPAVLPALLFVSLLGAPPAGAATPATLHGRLMNMHAAPALIYLKKIGAADHPGPGNETGTPARISSTGNRFKPDFQVRYTGSRLDILSEDSLLHNTHIFAGDRTLFNVATPIPNVPVSKILPRPGVFSVHCDLHPWMRAWLLVVNSPYYAVLWDKGDFVIKGVPPGRYRLHVWQANDRETVETVTLQEGEQKKIDVHHAGNRRPRHNQRLRARYER